jgi:hypothetical protein
VWQWLLDSRAAHHSKAHPRAVTKTLKSGSQDTNCVRHTRHKPSHKKNQSPNSQTHHIIDSPMAKWHWLLDSHAAHHSKAHLHAVTMTHKRAPHPHCGSGCVAVSHTHRAGRRAVSRESAQCRWSSGSQSQCWGRRCWGFLYKMRSFVYKMRVFYI